MLEMLVKDIVSVLTEEYVKAFDESLEKYVLYNLSFWIHVDLAHDTSQIKSKVDAQCNEFVKKRIKSALSS